MMKPYNNLPAQQRQAQRIANEFDAEEQRWRSQGRKRRNRRMRRPNLSPEAHNALDQLEFARARPILDCIGVEYPTGRLGA